MALAMAEGETTPPVANATALRVDQEVCPPRYLVPSISP